MISLIFKIAVVYLALQYVFKVDVNGYVMEHLSPYLEQAEDKMPDAAKDLIEKAEPFADVAMDNAVVDYVKDRANAIDDAKKNVEALEKKMEELKEAADKATEGGN